MGTTRCAAVTASSSMAFASARSGTQSHRVHALRSLSAAGRDVVVETAGIERPIAWLGIANVEGANLEAFERTLEVAQALLTA